eukprot:12141608-Karenia_brevis.AAC.1
MQGIQDGLDRDSSTALLSTSKLDPYQAGVLRTIISGGIWTEDRAHRATLSSSNQCKYCATGAVEDHEHLWWSCPAWSHVRAQHGEATRLFKQEWPACVKRCGLIPIGWTPEDVHSDNQVVDLTSEDQVVDLTSEDVRLQKDTSK